MKAQTFLILLIFFVAVFFRPLQAQVTRIFESDTIFKGPESVAYDELRNCLYVSNYNRYPRDGMIYNEDYITKIDLNGHILEKVLVNELTCPTGICVLKDKLYIVERFGVVVFNLQENKTETRYRINNTQFLNDIAVDSAGTIYVSDSGSDIIYRIKDGVCEKWYEGQEIDRTNGVLVDGDRLIVGVNADSSLKAINMTDMTVDLIATLPQGTIDGIKKCSKGYLVSHYDGNLYLTGNDGKITELLNTRPEGIKCADFEYIEKLGLLYIPALKNNRLFIYRYKCE